MEIINIQFNPSQISTQIVISPRALALSARHLRGTFGDDRRFAVVTDKTVFAFYGEKLLKSLGETAADGVYFLPSGETAKCFDSVMSICQFLSERGFTRSDVLIGLGGGAVCDVTGFAASIYLRGMRLALVPTTLLAMCDAAIGGKTAVDTAFGKNSLGSFYPASLILEDTTTLSTLQAHHRSDGFAEIIKTAFVAYNAGYDDALLRLCNDIWDNVEEIVKLCANIKAALVCGDLHDNGVRNLLNFGHTVGHAVEFLSGYNISHGGAVSIGMAAAARASVKSYDCTPETRDHLCNLLTSCLLPTECPFTAEQIFEVAKNDKKRRGEQTSIIMLCDHGVKNVIADDDGLMKFIRDGVT